MDAEQAFLAALQASSQIAVEASQLTLLDADGGVQDLFEAPTDCFCGR